MELEHAEGDAEGDYSVAYDGRDTTVNTPSTSRILAILRLRWTGQRSASVTGIQQSASVTVIQQSPFGNYGPKIEWVIPY